MRPTIVARIALLTAVALAPAACRTPGSAGAVKDFDTAASAKLDLGADYPFQYCADAKDFRVTNAYWSAYVSDLAYGSIAAIEAQIAKLDPSLGAHVDYITTPPELLAPLSGLFKFDTQIIVLETKDAAIVGFRGTQPSQLNDLTADGEFHQVPFPFGKDMGNVHVGFKGALDIVFDKLRPHLLSIAASGRPILLTGHSLGGALATMALARIATDPDLAESALPKAVKGLYTFGSPRVGDAAFTAALAGAVAQKIGPIPLIRFRNNRDFVSRVPPTESRLANSLRYAHFGDLYFFDHTGALYVDTTDGALPAAAMPLDMRLGMIENWWDYPFITQIAEGFGDHGMDNYLRNIERYHAANIAWSAGHGGDVCAPAFFADQKAATFAAVSRFGRPAPAARTQIPALDPGQFKDLGYKACTGAATLLANYAGGTRDIDYQNACQAKWGRSQLSACLQSATAACDLMLKRGAIDIGQIIATNPNLPWENTLRSLVNTAGTNACRLGGPVSATACTVINQAAGQIQQAITKGTNDWAHCLGIDQGGACLGALWTQWTTGVPLAAAQTGVSTAFTNAEGEATSRNCCICQREWWQSRWFSDTLLQSGYGSSVAEQGTVGIQACKNKAKHKIDQGNGTYVWYPVCSVESVKGGSCSGTAIAGSKSRIVDVGTGPWAGPLLIGN